MIKMMTANQRVSFLPSHQPISIITHKQKVRHGVELLMRGIGAKHKHIFFRTIPNIHHHHHREVLKMAEKETQKKKQDQLIEEEKTKEKEKEKEKENKVPPPPEKPLPGDCCGSGCVRCVWDIYYEELEDYNNLLKQNDSRSKP